MVGRVVLSVGLAAAFSSDAVADRPSPGNGYPLGTELSFSDSANGAVRVWYTQEGEDAVPTEDENPKNGVPDYVDSVAEVATYSLGVYVEMGYRPIVVDSEYSPAKQVGGDDKLDIYLANFGAADGSFPSDFCNETPNFCTGHAVIENDFAGASYESTLMGIKTVVSHELFHGVQHAYDSGQDARWSEGSAVWAEEQVYPEQNDFERFAKRFLAKTNRPFDRDTGSSFGDPYPYGTAVWASFLAENFDTSIIRKIWERCEDLTGDDIDFLSATDLLLSEEFDTTLAETWHEFALWNVYTGERANPGRAYQHAGEWGSVTFEEEQTGPSWSFRTSLEGLSSAYIPVSLSEFAGETTFVVDAEKAPGISATLVFADGETTTELPFIEEGETQRILRFDEAPQSNAVLVLSSDIRGAPLRRVTVSTLEPTGGCQSAPDTPANALCSLLLLNFIGSRISKKRKTV